MRRLACFAGGFSAAVFLFVYALPLRAAQVLAAVCLVAAIGAFFVRKGWAKRAALILMGVAAGLGWCGAYWSVILSPLDALDGATMSVHATASGYSARTSLGAAVPVRLSLDARTYDATLYFEKPTVIVPGDTLDATAYLRVNGDRPGAQRSYQGAKGQSLSLSVRGELACTPADKPRLRDMPAVFSQKLRTALEQSLDTDSAAFMKALVTGDRSELPFAVTNDLSVAGLYHAVAISGMHISILLGILLLLLGRRRRLAALVGLPIIWFYAVAVGAGAPVVRAAIMQSFLLLAPLFGRENDLPTALLTALAVLLLPNPRAAADVGLQLSFASITGISLFSGRCFNWLWSRPRLKRLRKRSQLASHALKTVLATFAASLAVIPLTLPLSAVYFGMFSLIAPLASVLVLPVISLCFTYGILAGLAAMVSAPVGLVLAWPLRLLVRYCTGMAHLLAKIPFSAVYTSGVYMIIFLVFFYSIVLLFTVSRRKGSPLIPISCTAAMLCLCLLLGSLELDRAQATITMLDVGQGQCVYLESGGAGLVYDCGGSGEKTGEIAARYLSSVGRGRLDALAISHYDADHAEGAAYLLARVRVDTVYLPLIADEKGMQAQILDAAAQYGANVVFVEQDLTLPFGGGSVSLFAPVDTSSANDGSVAALLSVADFDVLLTGDMSTQAEQQLLLGHSLPDIEVLAAGHHGAKTSTSAALLRTLRPETVLISVGENNAYGHPSDETIARLEKADITYYRTDQCGAITIRR